MRIEVGTYKMTERGSIGTIALAIGLIGLAVSAYGYSSAKQQFFYSYLNSFFFWLWVPLGALFFTMLHHLVNAQWSVVMRRISETVMMNLPLMFIFFIPLLFGMGELYHWSHPEAVAHDEILAGKQSFLNNSFFYVRVVIYFVVWIILAGRLYRLSLAQDREHSETLMSRLRRTSGPGIVLFGLTTTFAGFDWLMSLDPHWYSTIFGVYLFAGGVVATVAFFILAAIYLRTQNVMATDITVEHYHDLGKLLFAFIVFWTYQAFSQYFLIWYANIPEETVWFKERWVGSWKTISLLLIFGHFAVPFLLLLFRNAKRVLPILGTIALWMLAMRWVDLHWIIMPNLHHQGVAVSWMDVSTMIGIGGVFVWSWWRRFTAQPLVPVKDPNLQASRQFINV
jgi:hypothetical protein